MNILAGLTDASSKAGSFNLSIDQLIRIAIPTTFGTRELTKVRRDCEILLERLEKNPQKLQELVKLANSGKVAEAQDIVHELKLTEEDFEKEGGGCIWLLVVVIIILCTKKAY